MLPYRVATQLFASTETPTIEQVMRLKLQLPFSGGICLHVYFSVLEIEIKNVKDIGRRLCGGFVGNKCTRIY